MRVLSPIVATVMATAMVIGVVQVGPAAAAPAAPVAAPVGTPVGAAVGDAVGAAVGAAVGTAVGTSSTAAACPTTSPAAAITASVSNARRSGVTQAIAVVDRGTGTLVGSTANLDSQMASESLMKLFLAAYYLVLYGGYTRTPADVKNRLSYMLRYSDDATASAMFTANAIPSIAARYGMPRTTNATDRPGHWGAARVTARDMTTFLSRAAKDAAVGPWLIPVMAQTTAVGSDGFNQKFGLNALSGIRGSKQGWGGDSFFTQPSYAIHSVGYTGGLFVAVLQLGPASTYPDPMRATATYGARQLQAADPNKAGITSAAQSTAVATDAAAAASPAVPNGTFIRVSGRTEVYRVVGGAPLYVVSWGPWGGHAQPVRTVSQAQFATLRTRPADGTYVRAMPSSRVYRIAGGSALYVSKWAAVGGSGTAIGVDLRAITRAGTGGVYNHLNKKPADGTFVRTFADKRVYRFAGGAPIAVASWAGIGGVKPATIVDIGVARSSGTGYWNNVSTLPAAGTLLRADSTGKVYVVAGGGPVFVPGWACLGGGARPTVTIDAAAVAKAGGSGPWRHLRFYPTNTFIRGYPSAKVYRVVDGVPRWLKSWAGYGGPQPTVLVPQVSIDRAGLSGGYEHLKPAR